MKRFHSVAGRSPSIRLALLAALVGAGLLGASCSHVNVAKTCSAPYARKGGETLEACESERAPASRPNARTQDPKFDPFKRQRMREH